MTFEAVLLKKENEYLNRYENEVAYNKLIKKYDRYVRIQTSFFPWLLVYALFHFFTTFFINQERNLDNPYWYAILISCGLFFSVALVRILKYHFFTKKVLKIRQSYWEKELIKIQKSED